jgi:uncharacterized protein YggU (UPF0235/DUF167 family)
VNRAAVRFYVRLTPRGGADRVDGVGPDGELRCRVRAAPAAGEANAALIRLLASGCGAPRTDIAIESGWTARRKRVRVDGLDGGSLAGRWPGLVVEDPGR